MTFTGGSTSETVTVKVNGDTTDESDETFNVDLSSPTERDDRRQPGRRHDPERRRRPGDLDRQRLRHRGQHGREGLRLHGLAVATPPTSTITVDYATANGTATTGDSDYDAATGTVTFAPGDTSETVTVKVNGDNTDESDETFNVNLTNASANSSIARRPGRRHDPERRRRPGDLDRRRLRHRGQRGREGLRLHRLAVKPVGPAGHGRLRDRQRHRDDRRQRLRLGLRHA